MWCLEARNHADDEHILARCPPERRIELWEEGERACRRIERRLHASEERRGHRRGGSARREYDRVEGHAVYEHLAAAGGEAHRAVLEVRVDLQPE